MAFLGGARISSPVAEHNDPRVHRRFLCAKGSGGGDEFAGKSAYEVLEVSETSSATEIKASFRRLAKETHPDLSGLAASKRFLAILAAYEILSDSKKRALYDSQLFSRRVVVQTKCGHRSVHVSMYSSSVVTTDQPEVVEWLKWYRLAINDIIRQERGVVGSGYLDQLESELYEAIRAAYYGPVIESWDLLPDCFEAEERSANETTEVLHLVSGRDLFGIVHLADKVPELSHVCSEKLAAFNSTALGISVNRRESTVKLNSGSSKGVDDHETQVVKDECVSDTYKDLELHISGRVFATATRSPPKGKCDSKPTEESEDRIHVFLNLNELMHPTEPFPSDFVSCCSSGSKILLGTISGLGTSADEGCCSIYDRNGTKTHLLVKYRTLMVKHMHWYQVGNEVSACECRCSRARLPASKFWLFEPRSSMHDIGGWYVETFGRDKKGRTIPSAREWYATSQNPESRLHPAMYLLAIAYRTLDIEDTKRKTQTFRNFLAPTLHSILHWCKKLL